MGEAEFIFKFLDLFPLPLKHPREHKKNNEKKMAKKNFMSILWGTFDFNPEEYLDKSLFFDLKKLRE